MNHTDALRELLELLERYSFIVHEDLIPEMLALIQKSGKEKKVYTTLAARLQILAERKQFASEHKEFEPIGDGLYSMHIAPSGVNLRILYAFRSPDTCLLLAFYERAGKRRTDYSGKKKIALNRLKEL